MPDAPAAFVPSHLAEGTVLHGGPDVAVTGNPTTIDTDRLTIDGATSPWFVLRNGYAVLFANRVVFDHDVVITGPRPLIVAADGDVTVSASIDLSAHGQAPGPGAATFGAGEGGPGDTYITAGGEVRVSSGGGGGGHGSPGAPGGGNDELIRAGVGGMVYGAQLSDRLLGGAPGGVGGVGGTAGGAGGGALQISSATSISITGPHIAAGGGGGEGGGGSTSGGAGGGAGGQLFLEAPVLTIASTLAANGGGGGGGGGEGGIEGGTDGADGLIGDAPASGGVAGVPMGSDGGAGAAGTAASFVGAQPGGGGNAVAGGGGGGAGRIWLRYQKHRGLVTTGAVISPPATLDPTLP